MVVNVQDIAIVILAAPSNGRFKRRFFGNLGKNWEMDCRRQDCHSVDSLQSLVTSPIRSAKPYKAQYAAKAAEAAKATSQMLLLMLLLQLRIDGFCLICNDWWLLRCEEPPPQPSPASDGGSKDKYSDDYRTTGGEQMGYLLEEHFVTLSRGWR